MPNGAALLCNVRLVNIKRGTSDELANLLIRDSKIVDRPARCEGVDPEAKKFDLGGKYLAPGLWDMHVHALWDKDVAKAMLPRFVGYGVTGIRDMGGKFDVLALARQRLAAGEPYPTIFAAGLILDGPEPVDPAISIAISNSDDVDNAIKQLRDGGSDFVKVYTLLPENLLPKIVSRAAKEGMHVVGHVPAGMNAQQAAAAGLMTIEHMRDEIAPICDPSADNCEDAASIFLARSIFLTPTLVVLDKVPLVAGSFLRNREFQSLPGAIKDYWRASHNEARRSGASYVVRRRDRFNKAAAQIRFFNDAGVPVLAGTDAGTPASLPGRSLHDELQHLVDSGLTPREALASATVAPRRLFQMQDDPFAVGSEASFLILRNDPLIAISNIGEIDAIVLRGQFLSQDHLKKLRSAR